MAVAYQTIKGASGLYVPVGMIMSWTKASTPTGFLICDGSAVSRTTYAALFDAIGTTHGVGDGSTTFNLPDLQGKLPVGDDGGVSYTVAGTGGSQNVTPTLTKSGSAAGTMNGDPDVGNLAVSVSGNIADTTLSTNQIPSHSHSVAANGNGSSGTAIGAGLANFGRAFLPTTNTGGGGAHNHSHNLSGVLNGAPSVGNLAVTINDNIAVNSSAIDTRSPYIVIRYVIKF